MRQSGFLIQKRQPVSLKSRLLHSPSKRSRVRWRFPVQDRFCFRVIGIRPGIKRNSRRFGKKLFDGPEFLTFGCTTSGPPVHLRDQAQRWGRGRRVGNTGASTERRASDEEVLADETADEARSTREAKPSSERNGRVADCRVAGGTIVHSHSARASFVHSRVFLEVLWIGAKLGSALE